MQIERERCVVFVVPSLSRTWQARSRRCVGRFWMRIQRAQRAKASHFLGILQWEGRDAPPWGSSEGGASPYFLVGACRNVCVGTNGNELCSFAPFGEPVQTVAKEANFAQTFYGVADVSESTLLKHLLENPADFRLLRTSADFLKTVQYFCIVLVWLSSSYCVPPMVLLCPRSMFFRSMFGRLQVRSPSQPS